MSFQAAIRKLKQVGNRVNEEDLKGSKRLQQLEKQLNQAAYKLDQEYQKCYRTAVIEARKETAEYNRQHRAPRELGKVYTKAVPNDYFYGNSRLASSSLKLIWKVVGLEQQYRTKRQAQRAAKALLATVRAGVKRNSRSKTK